MKEGEEKSNYWLERLELTEFRNYYLEELSKGNQQKVQFISAIQHDPEILILDEPFSGFDPVNQSIFRDVIDKLKDKKFIILSTHLMDLAESLCDEICLINKGNKVIDGNLKEILDSSNQSIFELTISNPVLEVNSVNFNGIDIIEQNGNKLIIDVNETKPEHFIRSISNQVEIKEFRKINPSLHKLFLSLVKK